MNKVLKLTLPILSICTILISTMPLSSAIEGGFTKDSYLKIVVPLMEHESDSLPYCSGVLIDDFVIATAAHCVVTGLNTVRREIWIGPAGVDLQNKPKLHRVNNILVSKSYARNASGSVQDKDIAFLTIKTPLLNGIKIKVASMAEVKALYGQALVVGGYGADRPKGNAMHKPSFVQQKVIDLVLPQFTFGTYVHIVASDTESPCPGDSGGPIFKENGSEFLVIGTIAGANGCHSTLAIGEKMVGFLISAFDDLKNQAFSFVSQPANQVEGLKVQIVNSFVSLTWKEQSEAYLNSTRGYRVEDSSGQILCEANTIEIFKNQSGCEFNMPENARAPFTLTPIGLKKNGPQISLELVQASNYYKIKAADAAAKAQADAAAKAQADAAAKAQADAAAKAQADISKNSTTPSKTIIKKITCRKGKTKKIVSGLKPKCPSGYKMIK